MLKIIPMFFLGKVLFISEQNQSSFFTSSIQIVAQQDTYHAPPENLSTGHHSYHGRPTNSSITNQQYCRSNIS